MKNIILTQLFLLLFCTYAVSQVGLPSQPNQVKVENLSDDEIRQLVLEMKRRKVSFDQIDSYAEQKNIPLSEVAKLKDRIKILNLEKELKESDIPLSKEQADRSISDATVISARDIQPMTAAELRRSKIFGSELFSNQNLTFEPNLRMPTPPNYKLASGDELIIDVYGYSEVQHQLKVSPDGYIRIPNLGPVYVNDLTIEEAKNRITKQLSVIYSSIKSGNTFVKISLGNIRSIRVLLIGEVVKPGSYTLPSLATVANALYISGGPSENGSFREIQVIRNSLSVATFDLYDFLRNGDLTNNIVLQDQDIIKVSPYKVRVELSGEIKRPAIFEVKTGETLQDIIDIAGGYTDISFRDVIRAYRINNKEREVVNILANEVSQFVPQSGDKYFIEAVLNRFTNRVMISGAVFHPGEYALENNMTVLDLIKKADGIMEEALMGRAIIFRLNKDHTPSSTSFNLQDVLSGQKTVQLHREDSIVIYSKVELKEKYQVKISGEVNIPGYYDYADSLHVEDLILMAGGLKDAASLSRIEIARRIKNKEYDPNDPSIAIVAQFDINANLTSQTTFALQPFDEVIIRKSPVYQEQANVSIDGEVIYPGVYIINSKRERISDLLARAGGLKPEAYAEGAVLLRKTFINESDSALLNSKLQVYYNKLEDSASIASVQNAVSKRDQLLGINLTEIAKNPKSKYDLYLEEGDVIKIPKKLQTVQLFGEIYFPKKVRFDKANTFRDYIHGAGGFTNAALKRGSYIVYANGEVKSSRKVLFFNRFPKVKPGAEIYIPKKGERKGLTGQEALGITTGIASVALIIITILDKIR